MDPLTLLVRESAQNSLDAVDPTGNGVRYSIGLSQPRSEQLLRWRSLLCPGPERANLGIEELFNVGNPVMVVISDRGTQGLGGPLHADVALAPGADFVKLLRNIGEPRDRQFGGGTYGFGKGALFTTSSIGTILIRTRCRWQGRLQTRLIAAALGTGFQRNGRVYTGRHWWGPIIDGVPDPMLDTEAENIASCLDLPQMHPEETGTDIVIVGATLGTVPMGGEDDEEHPRTVHQAAEHLASAMMWNLWPLMLPTDAEVASLHCQVTADGVNVPVPRPEEEPAIRPFVDAYRALDDAPTIIRRKRPATVLGRLAIRTGIAPIHTTVASLAAPFTGSAHHCARMREPRLIVDYLEGPRSTNAVVHYGAVFLADHEHDQVFADAEPPTHDAWVPDKLTGNAASIIRRAEVELLTELATYVERQNGMSLSDGTQPPLGALSSRLAGLIPTASGPGADASGGTFRPGGGGSSAAARITSAPRMVRLNGASRIVAGFQVHPTSRPVTVQVVTSVALDVGNESEPPIGADSPVVLELCDKGDRIIPGDTVTVGPADSRDWTVVIRPASGAAARVRLLVTEGDDA
ncbi:hypothetical protein ABT352_16440 [Streptosporangium sp. NPDC000563]|uniref:hypothetical protein n=1 Tax=Streptosporangium sp. NPDC000563 TaxID=3154366 RepID=UPI00332F7D54